MNESNIQAWEVSVSGQDWKVVVNATSRGKAKAEYHRQVLDAWPGVPFTAMRASAVGRPRSSRQFILCAEYRGLPNLRCGDKVKVGQATGTVVGHNASSNFEVLFDADSKEYAGQRLSVHPESMQVIAEQKGGA